MKKKYETNESKYRCNLDAIYSTFPLNLNIGYDYINLEY